MNEIGDHAATPPASGSGNRPGTLVFCFQRAAGLDHAGFERHYLETHAPLGARLTRGMRRYVVNLARVGHLDDALLDDPHDAITVIDVADVDAFFDPRRAFASAEDARTLMDDHATFIGRMDAYLTAPGGSRPAPGSGPLAKVVARMQTLVDPALVAVREGIGAAIVHRVIDARTADAPPLAAVVEAWGPDAAAVHDVLVALDPHALVLDVVEHVIALPG